jgi:glycosyltransferase involved in cell wall biosynthesis
VTALPEVSIIVPVFNEQDNVAELAEDLARIMKESGASHEVIFIDDGSTDKTVDRLQDVQKHCPETRVIQFRRNFGQTAAMAAGFEHARGRVIVPMDGDLQNDPADIPLLLNKLSEGYDVVSGWRRNRQDKVLTRKIPSWIANYLIGKITGVNLHDYGCTLKAYRKDVVEHIRLYGEMHRFIPALASWSGANVTELEVNHRPRVHGRTKYGLGRTIRVILDLITVKFLGTFSTKPLHIFGGIGLLVFLGAFLLGCVVIYQKISSNFSINRNPLFTLTAVLGLMSIQFLLMGLLAEMMARTYHESQNKPTYVIRQIFEPNDMKSTAVGDAEDG